jgi:hypothetical protein
MEFWSYSRTWRSGWWGCVERSAAQEMRLIQRTVERAFRLPCRYSYRHSPKNAGTDAGVAT